MHVFPFRVKKAATCVNETDSDIIAVREQDVKGDWGRRRRRRETSFFFRRRSGWAAEEVA